MGMTYLIELLWGLNSHERWHLVRAYKVLVWFALFYTILSGGPSHVWHESGSEQQRHGSSPLSVHLRGSAALGAVCSAEQGQTYAAGQIWVQSHLQDHWLNDLTFLYLNFPICKNGDKSYLMEKLWELNERTCGSSWLSSCQAFTSWWLMWFCSFLLLRMATTK